MKKDNILLANFLNWERNEIYNFITNHYQNYLSTGNGICQTSIFREEELCFHKSWDWLMPVIDKIMDICFNEEEHSTYDSDKFYEIRDCIPDLFQTYNAVVEFVEQYNKNK